MKFVIWMLRVFLFATVTLTCLALLHDTAVASTSEAPQDIPIAESSHPYANSYDNTWMVTNGDAQATSTRVHFSRLELESRVDFLIITDIYGNEFQRITGVYTTGLWTDPVIGRHVRIRLVTDSSVNAWGFAVDQLESVAQSAILFSTHPYSNNSTQAWTQTNPACNGSGTRLHFTRLDLEDGVDWLIVKDVFGTAYQYLTGSYPTGVWTVAVPGASIQVQLVSDGSVVRWGLSADQTGCSAPASPTRPPTLGPILAETEHPYNENISQTWTLVNPNAAAISSKVHFRRLVVGDISWHRVMYVTDVDGRVIQTFYGGTNRSDFWSTSVTGTVVKVQLIGIGESAWGFQIDDIADGESKPLLAETEHEYSFSISQTLTLINPNSTATSSKIHFRRLSLCTYSRPATVYIRDVDGRLMQTFQSGVQISDVYEASDFWSTYVPGSVVRIQYITGDCFAWGLQVDDIADGESKPVLAETEHNYSPWISQTWTLVNPNAAAVSSTVHFRRLALGSGGNPTVLSIRDVNGQPVQTLAGTSQGTDRSDFWSAHVTGTVVKVQLAGNGGTGWGFQIDDIQPQGSITPTPAFIGGIYITVNAPGDIYLNDQLILHVGQAGEYKIPIPGYSKSTIRVEYLHMTQSIEVTLGPKLTIVYLPVTIKSP